MKKSDKLDKLLEKRAKLDIPALKPDPFLATRIEANADEKRIHYNGSHIRQWSFAAVMGLCGILTGIFLSNLSSTTITNTEADYVNNYLEALNQNSIADDWSGFISEGATNEE